MMKKIMMSVAVAAFLCAAALPLEARNSRKMKEFITDCEKSDFVKTPKFAETKAYFQKLEEASPMVHNTSFGTSPLGRELSLVIVDKDGLTTPEAIRAKGRVIILIESCIHAGEPDGKDASMIFLRDMVIGKKNIDVLDDVSFLFVPVFNVDGHENFTALNRINQNGPEELGTRNTSQQLNLNRDFLKGDAPEMKAWLKMYNYWLPEMFIDVHVTNGADFQYVMTYAIDNMTDNMEPGITKWSSGIYEKQLCSMMEKAGYPIFLYGSFKKYNAPETGFVPDTFDPRYSQGYAAAHNRLALLIENHIYKPYKQRVDATVEAFIATARILADNKESLQKCLAEADAYTSSPASRVEPFGFQYKATDEVSYVANYLSWGRDTVKSDLSGGEWVTHDYNDPITLQMPVYASYKPSFTIKLPEAYILMPQWKNVVELLDLHGVKYTVMQEAAEVQVETYRYKGGKFSSRQSEGRIPVQAEFTTQVEKLTYPAGSIYIDMNQPAARVAMWMLEPAAPGSLTYWGFFNVCVQAGNEFWIRPQYMEEKGREMLAKDPQLKAAFEQKLREDAEFAANPQAILMYFYDIVRKRAHQNNELHPVWRVMGK
ncbi:MAG: M14 family metallopeptidase [Bacteroidales bacterium]|nr:M14 family metallopeptidase [Bacteroidales bacterium]